jgi:hypothetical protein
LDGRRRAVRRGANQHTNANERASLALGKFKQRGVKTPPIF